MRFRRFSVRASSPEHVANIVDTESVASTAPQLQYASHLSSSLPQHAEHFMSGGMSSDFKQEEHASALRGDITLQIYCLNTRRSNGPVERNNEHREQALG